MKRRLVCLLPAALALAACDPKPNEQRPGAGTPSASPAAEGDAYRLAASGHGFSLGPVMAAHPVYVFFDPTCPHCAQLWENSKPLQQKARTVWIPVALRSANEALGAAILDAPDPVAAMEQNEARVLAGAQPAPPATAPNPEAVNKVRANTELLRRLGGDSVPFIVFQRGDQPATHAGAVGTAELAAMARVTAQ